MRTILCSFVLVGTILSCEATRAQGPRGRIAVWDTGSPSAHALLGKDVADKKGWRQKKRNAQVPEFAGDAVLSNGRIAVVVRKNGAGADVYSVEPDGPVRRVTVSPRTLAVEPASRLDQVSLVEHTRAAARLEAVFRTEQGLPVTVRFRIKRGGIFLEAEPGPGAELLRVEAPGRYVVLPDFFADDILIDATKIPVATAEVPSENFLLHMIGAGSAIAMCVFENSDQDVRITFADRQNQRVATGSEIRFGKDRKIWVALMTGSGIWAALDVTEQDAGKIIPLDWKAPFPAQWRVDFTRRNELTDSWEMLYPDKLGSGYIKPSWLPGGSQGSQPSRTSTGEIDVDAYKVGGPASNRVGPERKRWITFLGRYQYPCWTDRQGKAFIQPLKHKKLMFRGPAVVYPINRLPETPIDTYTTVDIVRGTLGVGPCEYILNVEGQRQDHVGRATCHVRRLLKEIYEGNQQKKKRSEIENYLGDGLDFVKHIRHRIALYLEFGQQMREYLAAQKNLHPEQSELLTEMETIVGQLDERLTARRDGIKSVEYVVTLNEGFRKSLLDYEGSDSMIRLKEYTDALTGVGGSQDSLVGECRWIVRTLRQRASLAIAVNPEFASIAKEIRARTQSVLLKPSAYEGARH